MSKIHIPIKWEYSVSVPFDEIKDYLSDEDYHKYKNEYLRLHVLLEYENNLGDKDTGIEPSFEYQSWSAIDSYPDSVLYAIDEHLSSESQRYADEAYEKLCDFIDYQKYGEY